MSQTRSGPRALLAVAGIVAILATACSTPTASTAPSTAPSASSAAVPSTAPATAEPIDAAAPVPNGGAVIRWFVGLGAGGQPQQITAQTDFVTKFNNDP